MVAREIPLTNGGVVLVDEQDYEAMASVNWQRHKHGYAYRCKSRYRETKQHGLVLLMHREILAAPPHLDVDHIDGNPANNQRANLRLCASNQNLANQRKAATRKGKPCSSPYVGVSRHGNGWVASASGKYVGKFKTAEEAAIARDAAMIAIYGDFARLNVINSTGGKK